MSTSAQTIAKILSAFADAMDSMDERQFELLMRGEAKLRIVEEQSGAKKTRSEPMCSDQAVAEVAQKLNEAQSREDAERLIASVTHPRRKSFLISLSKACGVNVTSRDSIARIEQKLIENVVGSRLGSEAIKKLAL